MQRFTAFFALMILLALAAPGRGEKLDLLTGQGDMAPRQVGDWTREGEALSGGGIGNLLEFPIALNGSTPVSFKARLVLEKLDATAASVAVGGSNHFGFDALPQHMLFVQGADIGSAKTKILVPAASFIQPGEPFEVELRTGESMIHYLINGTEVYKTQLLTTLSPVAIRPHRNNVKVLSATLESEAAVEELQAKAQPAAAELLAGEGAIDLLAETGELAPKQTGNWTDTGSGLRGTGVNTLLEFPVVLDPATPAVFRARISLANLSGSAASVVLGTGNHFGLDGSSDPKIFVLGPAFQAAAPKMLTPAAGFITPGQAFELTILSGNGSLVFSINGKEAHRTYYDKPLSPIALRPHRNAMLVESATFQTEGGLEAMQQAASQNPGPVYPPVVELWQDESRQYVVASEPGQYFGHPTTVLMEDGKTIFCTYPLGHGGPSAVLKKSTDGGKTWSEELPVPDNWITASNCPSIYRVTSPKDGVERLIVMEGRHKLRQSISTDDGETWTPFEENGLISVVPPITLVPVEDGKRHMAVFQRGPNDAEANPMTIWRSYSDDGGLTWGPMLPVAQKDNASLCEPHVLRSPDGKQLLCIMRENYRNFNSIIVTSEDEGQTWSEPYESAAAVTGDRHLGRYLPDGRIVMAFRDMGPDSPTKYHFVAWVGTYEDLVNSRPGEYKVKLLHSYYGSDTGYPGLELLPDGTIVATTYVAYRPEDSVGGQNSVVSVHFKIDETDKMVAAKQ